jgi:hypothetical protein
MACDVVVSGVSGILFARAVSSVLLCECESCSGCCVSRIRASMCTSVLYRGMARGSSAGQMGVACLVGSATFLHSVWLLCARHVLSTVVCIVLYLSHGCMWQSCESWFVLRQQHSYGCTSFGWPAADRGIGSYLVPYKNCLHCEGQVYYGIRLHGSRWTTAA